MDAVQLLKDYLAIPSVSTDPEFNDAMTQAHDFVADHLKDLGFSVESINYERHPIIFAQRIVGENLPHIALYAHYDVQPADPYDLWVSPPFTPTVRGSKIFARGACDNKGPFISQLVGLSRALKDNPDLPLNITFLVEGEEEIGSPSFPQFLKEHGHRLGQADCLLVSDGMSPSKEQIGLKMALRGIAAFHLELAGPKVDLHSGLYGGAVLNPNQALVDLLSSLHDDYGRVNIPGFYDDVLFPEDWQRESLKQEAYTESKMQADSGVPHLWSMEGFSPKEGATVLPTLEINGIFGGYQGDGFKTVIPAKAGAKISCRLVHNQNFEKIEDLVVKTLQERTPPHVELTVTKDHGGNPYRVTPPGKPGAPDPYPPKLEKAMDLVQSSIEAVTQLPPAYIHLGGSIPIIESIYSKAKLHSVMFGLALPEDAAHSPNESFDLDVLETGAKLYHHLISHAAL